MKREKVLSLRLTNEEFAYLANWSKNSGKSISDILRGLISNSRDLDRYFTQPAQSTVSTSITCASPVNFLWQMGREGMQT